MLRLAPNFYTNNGQICAYVTEFRHIEVSELSNLSCSATSKGNINFQSSGFNGECRLKFYLFIWGYQTVKLQVHLNSIINFFYVKTKYLI